MDTFLKLVSFIASAVGLQLATSGVVYAVTVSSLPVDSLIQQASSTQPPLPATVTSEQATKATFTMILADGSYQPPDNGAPGSSTGSGTR